jgi:hypothetical protein
MDFSNDYLVLSESDLKLTPNKNAENISVLKEGEKVDMLEGYDDLELNKIWYKVKTNDGKEGWCFSETLQKIQTLENGIKNQYGPTNSSYFSKIIKVAILISLVVSIGPIIVKQIKSNLPTAIPVKINLSTAEKIYSPERLYDFIRDNYTFDPQKWSVSEQFAFRNILINSIVYNNNLGVNVNIKEDSGEMINRLVQQNILDGAMSCVGYSALLGICLERLKGYSCYFITNEGHCWILAVDEKVGDYAMLDSTGYLTDSFTNLKVFFDNQKFKKTPINPAVIPVESKGETADFIFLVYSRMNL